MKNKTVLVTGGAGAIGANLVKALINSGNRVIVIDDLSSGNMKNFPSGRRVFFYRGSILNDSLFKKISRDHKKIDVVFHLAALFANQNSVEHPQKDLLANSLGTLKVLEFSRLNGVKRFVYTSSSCVYGNVSGELKEELAFNLETPYAISKFCGEQYVKFYFRFHKLSTVILRYFNVYGPGDPPGVYRNVIPNFMLSALQRKPLNITGTGEESRDFTYIDDIVKGTILAAEAKNIGGRIFNLGTGRELKIRYMAKLINRLAGNEAGIRFAKRRKWDTIVRRVANIEKSRKVLKYAPKVKFEDGLHRTFLWFKKNYSNSRWKK